MLFDQFFQLSPDCPCTNWISKCRCHHQIIIYTHKEALKRKAEVENQQNNGTFLPPNNQKVSDFLYDFVSTYGEKK